LDGAIADYNQAISLNPKLAEVWFNRAAAWVEKREMERAISDYSRAIEVTPGFANAYANRGLARLELGQEFAAQQDFTQCFNLDIKLKSSLEERIQQIRQKLAAKQ
jgi:tetratricopeptide (TPR) repeat protein